jgi:hypothetical protein
MNRKPVEMVEDARALRERAEKARTMGRGLTEPDRTRLACYAEELDAKAAGIESKLMNER